MTQMPCNQFNSLDYSDPMVCRVLNTGGWASIAVYIVTMYAALLRAGNRHLKQLSGSIGCSVAMFLSRVSVTLCPDIFFSTESVDKSVGKLFARPSSAVAVVFVTDWLKSNQSHKYLKKQ